MKLFAGCAVLLSLAACDAAGAPEPEATPTAAAKGDETIACAVNGAAEFKPVCAVERAEIEGTRYLVVRHPDGGFRRFEVLTDGHGLAAADGADEAQLKIDGNVLEAEVAGDRYRFPVTIGEAKGDR